MQGNDMIITIGRQFGSWGYVVGQKIAEDYGIRLYDKEMLQRAAEDSGMSEELFETHDEKPIKSFLYSLVTDTYSNFGFSSNGYNDMPLNHKVFLAQFDAIRKIADEGPCVLIGRCADYALEGYSNVVSVFIYADMDARIRKVADTFEITDAKAKEMIIKEDKKRANYYNYYTNKEWGDMGSYDLCINSAKLGIDGTAKAIEEYVKIKSQIINPKL